jgi:hypothetical protein
VGGKLGGRRGSKRDLIKTECKHTECNVYVHHHHAKIIRWKVTDIALKSSVSCLIGLCRCGGLGNITFYVLFLSIEQKIKLQSVTFS